MNSLSIGLKKWLITLSLSSFLLVSVILNAAPVVYIDEENDIFMFWTIPDSGLDIPIPEGDTSQDPDFPSNDPTNDGSNPDGRDNATSLKPSETVGGEEGGRQQELTSVSEYSNEEAQSLANPVGHLAGDFSVGGSGDVSYGIPIALPPGTAGVRPELGLAYNSQQGVGVAGKGWNLVGLSAVSRCGRTFLYDDRASSVQLNETDAFCLDGQRLFATSFHKGLDNQVPTDFGSISVVSYRKEIDDYSIIKGYFSGNQPFMFAVESKDGLVRTYGADEISGTLESHNARVYAYNPDGTLKTYVPTTSDAWKYQNTDTIVKWSLSTVVDKKDNYINYIYEVKNRNIERNNGIEDKNEFVGAEQRIKRIEYTGNYTTELQPYAFIDFDYGSETQQIDDVKFGKQSYIAGSKHLQSSLLRSIDVSLLLEGSAPSIIRQYKLSYASTSYDELNRHKRLASVEECVDSDGSEVCQPPTHFIWDGSHLRNFEFSGGAGADSNEQHANEFDLTDLTVAYAGFTEDEVDYSGFGWSTDLSKKANKLVGDINGDGFSDVVKIEPENESNGGTYTIEVVTSTGREFSDTAFSTSNFSEFLSPTDSPERRPANKDQLSYHLADFNGDGMSDLVGVGQTGLDILISDGNKFNRQPYFNNYSINGHDKNRNPRYFQDMNGDGKADFTIVTNQGVKVFLSDGVTFSSPEVWTLDFNAEEGLSFGWARNLEYYGNVNGYNDQLNFADVNGDGLPDAIGFVQYGVAVGLNTGDSFLPISNNLHAAHWTREAGNGYRIEETPKSVADVNGDGLADIIFFAKEGVKVAFSTGTSFTAFDDFGIYRRFGKDQGWTSSSDAPRHVVDVNGDGRADIVGFSEGSDVKVALSNGHRFYAANGNISWSTGFGNESGWNSPNNLRSFGDFNGDGLVDVIGINENGISIGDSRAETLRIRHIVSGSYEPPNPSVTEYDGLGRSIEVKYVPLTGSDGWHYNGEEGGRRVPMYVAARHASSNGDIGSGTSSKKAQMAYRYWGLKFDIGRKGRGILGFSKRRTLDEVTGEYTTTEYSQDFPHIGAVLESSTRAQNNTKLSTTTNVPAFSQVSSGIHQGAYRVWQESSTEKSYEYTDQKLVKRSETIQGVPDECGNISEVTSIASNENRSEEFQTITTSIFEPSGSCFQRSRLESATVVHSIKNDPDQTKTRTSSFTYYDSGQIHTETVEPDSEYELVTTYTYDDFGNVATKEVAGKDVVTRKTTTGYDPKGRFVTTIENGLNHKVEKKYNARFGTVTETTDANGLISRARYNYFGQKYLDAPLAGNVILTKYEWCDEEIENSEGDIGGTARYCITKQDQDIGPEQYIKTYYDSVDRVIRVETKGLGDQGTSKVVYTDKVYDLSTGRLIEESKPYYVGDSAAWVKYEYDDIGRTKSIKQPDNGIGSVEYAGLTTTKTDALGHETTVTLYPNGKTKKITDHLGNTTDFKYSGAGNIVETTVTSDQETNGASETSVTSFEYDLYGNKESMVDPDMGTWSYKYNALGELLLQTDAKDQTTAMTYDALGRMKTRTDSDGKTEWFYDGDAGDGRVRYVESIQSGKLLHRKKFEYTPRGQVGRVTETLPDDISEGSSTKEYVTSTEFDSYGRPILIHYPQLYDGASSVVLRYAYNNLGVMYRVTDANDEDNIHWQVKRTTASGKVLEHVLNATIENGGGITTETGYDVMEMTNSIVSTAGGDTLQRLGYEFDQVGNLKKREDILGDLLESFEYDELNRLKETITKYRVGQSFVNNIDEPETNSYDGHGNLLTNKGWSYTYDSQRTHAVRELRDEDGKLVKSYDYDANGNMESGDGRDITWTSFNKSSSITKGDVDIAFGYGVNRERLVKSVKDGTKTWYIGGLVERELKPSGSELFKFHLKVGGKGFGYITQNYDSSKQLTVSKLRYVLKDHLGSVSVVVEEDYNSSMTPLKLSFNSWGERRGETWNPLNSIQYDTMLAKIDAESVKRGFTGHEHDDEVGLINMGGRLYDAKIGRFISADPHVQAPSDAQSYNRYSYVKNNPLSYTDPSGFFFKKLLKSLVKFVGKWGRTIAAIAITFVPGLNVMAAGFISGMISSGGDLKQGLFSAISAGVFNAIGTAFMPAAGMRLTTYSKFLKVVAHGVAGGTMSVLRGGKFAEGFASAGLSQIMAVTGVYGRLGASEAPTTLGGYAKNAAIAAMVGGVSSKALGGKFENGAITAAFSRMFNDTASNHRRAMRGKNGIAKSKNQSTKDVLGFGMDSAGLALAGAACVATAGVGCAVGAALAGLAWVRTYFKMAGDGTDMIEHAVSGSGAHSERMGKAVALGVDVLLMTGSVRGWVDNTVGYVGLNAMEKVGVWMEPVGIGMGIDGMIDSANDIYQDK